MLQKTRMKCFYVSCISIDNTWLHVVQRLSRHKIKNKHCSSLILLEYTKAVWEIKTLMKYIQHDTGEWELLLCRSFPVWWNEMYKGILLTCFYWTERNFGLQVHCSLSYYILNLNLLNCVSVSLWKGRLIMVVISLHGVGLNMKVNSWIYTQI